MDAVKNMGVASSVSPRACLVTAKHGAVEGFEVWKENLVVNRRLTRQVRSKQFARDSHLTVFLSTAYVLQALATMGRFSIRDSLVLLPQPALGESD